MLAMVLPAAAARAAARRASRYNGSIISPPSCPCPCLSIRHRASPGLLLGRRAARRAARLRQRRPSARAARSPPSRPTRSRWCRAISSPRNRSTRSSPACRASRCARSSARSLLTDVFHADRWDYVFTHPAPGRRAAAAPADASSSRANVLERFEGDAMPSEEEFVATLDTRASAAARCPCSRPPKTSSSSSRRPRTQPTPRRRARRRCRRRRRRRAYPPLEAARCHGERRLSVRHLRRRGSAAWPSPAPPAAWASMLIEAIRARRRLPAGRRAGRRRQPRHRQRRRRLPGPRQRRADHRRPARGPGRRAGADRLHPPRRHAGAPGGVPRTRRAGGDRHHRLQRRAEGRDRRRRAGHRDRAWRPT